MSHWLESQSCLLLSVTSYLKPRNVVNKAGHDAADPGEYEREGEDRLPPDPVQRPDAEEVRRDLGEDEERVVREEVAREVGRHEGEAVVAQRRHEPVVEHVEGPWRGAGLLPLHIRQHGSKGLCTHSIVYKKQANFLTYLIS